MFEGRKLLTKPAILLDDGEDPKMSSEVNKIITINKNSIKSSSRGFNASIKRNRNKN
jgi:hypothetical protein